MDDDPQNPQPAEPAVTRQPEKRKHGKSVLAFILALVTVIGALGAVELIPQISVQPLEPIAKSQPFSVPFRIQNTGYLHFYVEQIFCYMKSVETDELTFSNTLFHDPGWDHFNLDRAESKTISCNLYKQVHPLPIPKQAELVIVVIYRPFRSFPHSFRNHFYFVGAYEDNWQWLAEPSDPVRQEADKAIDNYLRRIPVLR